MSAAASLERYSKHPLAQAVLNAAERAHLQLDAASEINEPPGQGLRGAVQGRIILLTGRNRVRDSEIVLPASSLRARMPGFYRWTFAAALRFHDAPRQDSRIFVEHLRPKHRVNRVLLVSGDRESEVRYLAGAVGISEIYAGQSPEQKVAIVREETNRAKTLFVGDGINDAPAMQAATVGIAFGLNSDVAAEAADAVILESSLGKVDELIHIGRRMRSIALQSAVGGMALSAMGMLAAAFGLLPAIDGAVGQELIDLVAVLNAVRVALPTSKLRDL